MSDDKPIPATHAPMMAMGIACNSCLHVYPGMDFCEAFPDGSDGIPLEIRAGRNDHTTEYLGDHGIRYEWDATCGIAKPRWAP